jgi:hypothetical protein
MQTRLRWRHVGSDGVCLAGVWRSALRCYISQESGFNRREDVFALDLLYKEICYKFCTFNTGSKNSCIFILFNDGFSVTQTIQRRMKW